MSCLKYHDKYCKYLSKFGRLLIMTVELFPYMEYKKTIDIYLLEDDKIVYKL